MKTIFDLCVPRKDVAEGRIRDEEFAADLARVVNADTSADQREYRDPVIFFEHTYPTRGLKSLLENVCRRLSGQGNEANSIIRLDTQYGGGKTHSLIALVHAVRGMKGVANVSEFIDPGFLPKGPVRLAALDGENADPANGLKLEHGLYAKSLWGEMAYRLAGRKGYELVRKSDESHTAPGDRVLVELFGGEPTLILIDEVSVYLRKVERVFPGGAQQFTAFIHALVKAVASTPRAALVCTLAVKAEDKQATDAYRAEQQTAMQAFDEAESVLARKATQINPTEEDETVDVLRRRLFERVDTAAAAEVRDSYAALWDRNRDSLVPEAFSPETRDQFRRGYPLHPETLNTLIEKTSSLSTFQRTRGMLRLLARTVYHLWRERPADAFAIHPHHIDPTFQLIRDEITTRWGQGAYAPALASDIASVPGKDPSTAQRLDQQNFPGQPPVTSYAARTIFLHTLAYGDAAQGIKPDHLRYSVCSPAIEPSFVESARKLFVAESLYLDDRPGLLMRFRVEPNLNQMIRRAMSEVDANSARDQLKEHIRELFDGRQQGFELVPFPAGPYEIPDDIGDGRPLLALLGYDAFNVSDDPTSLPAEIVRMATRKGTREELRIYRNNLVFIVADEKHCPDMKQAGRRRLALQELSRQDRIKDLAEHQQRLVREELEQSRFRVAQSIMQCYRHVFYPSSSAGGGEAQLGHTAIEIANVSDTPGNGQLHIKRALHDQKKLLEDGDAPDAPTFVRDQTALKVKGVITLLELRNEFRRAPKLSILLGHAPLVDCIRQGINSSVFIYRKGDLVWGPGDPPPSIEISENTFVHTLAHAAHLGLWPRPNKEPTTPDQAGARGVATPDTAGLRPHDQPADPATGVAASPSIAPAEGPLRQALIELFDNARKAQVTAIGEIKIKLFEAAATWLLHQAVATYTTAATTCHFHAEIQAEGINNFCMDFAGTITRANAVKSFLDSQIRTASGNSFTGIYSLRFSQPLKLAGSPDPAEAFIKAMTKYGGGEAFVEAYAAPEGL